MWAQQWGNIYDMVEPYPGKAGVDATPEMIAQVTTIYSLPVHF